MTAKLHTAEIPQQARRKTKGIAATTAAPAGAAGAAAGVTGAVAVGGGQGSSRSGAEVSADASDEQIDGVVRRKLTYVDWQSAKVYKQIIVTIHHHKLMRTRYE